MTQHRATPELFKRWIIREPVVDLRTEPTQGPRDLWEDQLLLTQLLFGEPVEVLETIHGWTRISALLQLCHTERGWHGYEGWVPESALLRTDLPSLGIETRWWPAIHRSPDRSSPIVGALSAGSLLVGELIEQKGWPWIRLASHGYVALTTPLSLQETLRRWLGSPYIYGGTSSYAALPWPQRRGVDCSGLVHLLERLAGRTVPRDAHDQWLLAQPLESLAQAQPGDYLFFGPEDPKGRIHHVMRILDECRLIESARSLGGVVDLPRSLRCRVHDLDAPNGIWNGKERVWAGRLTHL